MLLVKKRFDYIDISKGLGMLAIVWGHTMLVGLSHNFVYGYHIFLFFFLSGMMFSNEKYDSVISLVKSRCKSLLIPYFILSFATWLVWAAYNFFSHNPVNSFFLPLWETFVAQGTGGYLVHNAPLWFVSCLLFVEIVYFFISKNLRVFPNVIICVFGAFIGYLMILPNAFFDFTKLPWNMEAGFSSLIFYSLGNNLIRFCNHQKLIDSVKHHKVVSLLVVITFTILLLLGTIYNGRVTLGSNNFGKNPFVFYITGFCGIISTITFALLWNQTGKFLFDRIRTFVCWIGRNSFLFLALHYPLKMFVVAAVAKIFCLNPSRIVQENVFYSVVSFVVIIIITSIIVSFINRFHWLSFYKRSPKESTCKN